jgi:hypothetical protein
MGTSAGEWLSKLDNGDWAGLAAARTMGRLLGDIEVQVLTNAGWRRAGAFSEVGPIAREVQLVNLPENLPPGAVHLRLSMAQGYWKLDYVALARIGAPIEPIVLPVVRVTRGDRDDRDAFERLRDPERYLLTYPKDAYDLHFRLPADFAAYELFLSARGYYVEWIRQQWLQEENKVNAAEVFLEPRRVLRRLAPVYKRMEADVERIFWQSRIGRQAAAYRSNRIVRAQPAGLCRFEIPDRSGPGLWRQAGK